MTLQTVEDQFTDIYNKISERKYVIEKRKKYKLSITVPLVQDHLYLKDIIRITTEFVEALLLKLKEAPNT